MRDAWRIRNTIIRSQHTLTHWHILTPAHLLPPGPRPVPPCPHPPTGPLQGVHHVGAAGHPTTSSAVLQPHGGPGGPHDLPRGDHVITEGVGGSSRGGSTQGEGWMGMGGVKLCADGVSRLQSGSRGCREGGMACSAQVCEHTYTRCCHNVVVATHLWLLLLLLSLRAGSQSQLVWQVEDGAADELHVPAAVLPGRVLHAAVLERYVADLTGARGDFPTGPRICLHSSSKGRPIPQHMSDCGPSACL